MVGMVSAACLTGGLRGECGGMARGFTDMTTLEPRRGSPEDPATSSLAPRLSQTDWLVGTVSIVVVAFLLGAPLLLWPAPGFDPSWQTGLGIAHRDNLRFGVELSYTYGPWGWSATPTFVERSQAWGQVAFRLATAVGFASVVWMMARRGFSGLTCGVAVLVVGILAGWILSPDERLFGTLVGLAVLLLDRVPTAGHPYAGMAAFGALVALAAQVKVSTGLAGLALAAVVVVGTLRLPRQPIVLVVSFLLVFATAWMMAGQSPADIAAWIQSALANVSGYSGAMALYPSSAWLSVWGFALSGLAVLVFAWWKTRNSDYAVIARFSILAVLALSFYFALRLGFVRQEPERVASAFALTLPLWLWLVPKDWPLPRKIVVLAIPSLVLFTALLWAVPGLQRDLLNVSAKLVAWRNGLARLTESEPSYAEAEGLAKLRNASSYNLGADLRSELQQKAVQVDPWQTSLIWTYDLEWAPVPAFQPAVALTPSLDELNARALLSRPASNVLLTQSGEGLQIAGENPAWVSPLYQIIVRCHYQQIASDGDWAVLQNLGYSRCGEPRPVQTQTVQPGLALAVPPVADGQLLVARYSANLGLFQRALATIFKPPAPLVVSLDGVDYQLPWAFADGSPLLMCTTSEQTPESNPVPACARQAEAIDFSHTGTVTWEVIDFDLLGQFADLPAPYVRTS